MNRVELERLFRGKKVIYNNSVPEASKIRIMKHDRKLLDEKFAKSVLDYLTSQYTQFSNCTKVQVACALYDEALEHVSYGVNFVEGVNECQETFCKLDYGMKPKHRHTSCKALHSEVNAIQNWFKGLDHNPHYAFVTRYPCVGCLRKLSLFGIKVVYYSGKNKLDYWTTLISLNRYGILCIYL